MLKKRLIRVDDNIPPYVSEPRTLTVVERCGEFRMTESTKQPERTIWYRGRIIAYPSLKGSVKDFDKYREPGAVQRVRASIAEAQRRSIEFAAQQEQLRYTKITPKPKPGKKVIRNETTKTTAKTYIGKTSGTKRLLRKPR